MIVEEEVVYQASKTCGEFHLDDTFVRGLRGPVGSGKSVACSWETILRGCDQEPDKQGVRPVRWVAIRNSYRELVDTTIKTFFEWVPERYGKFRQVDMMWRMFTKLPDNTYLDFEILFRALDRPDDVKKLLSLELTGGWVNEAKEVPKQVIDMLQARVGRYPPKRRVKPSWYGIIMDTNSPDSDHWWYHMFEELRPEGWRQFVQPSGLSPEAENVENLPDLYYERMMSGKDQEWINVYIHGKYGFLSDGRPVYPEYNDAIHSTLDELEILNKVYVGVDFGLTPAACFLQQTATGQVQIIDELCTFDLGAVSFAKLLRKKMLHDFPKNTEFEIYGDPAGDTRSPTDETTPFQVLWAANIEAVPAYTNDWTIRREAVADLLMRLDFTGKPAFVIGPKAKLIRKSHAGGYKLKRIQVSGEERFKDMPDKTSKYSHCGDATQYAVLGCMGSDRVIGNPNKGKPLDYSYINRGII